MTPEITSVADRLLAGLQLGGVALVWTAMLAPAAALFLLASAWHATRRLRRPAAVRIGPKT